jgi:hypothetical protein
MEKWFFGKIQIRFWLKLFALLGIAAFLSVIIQKIVGFYFPLNWASFLVSIGAGGIVYCLTLFFLGYISADEKILIGNLIKKPAPVNE